MTQRARFFATALAFAGTTLLADTGHAQEIEQAALPPAISTPHPVYPAISRKLGEQGRVVIRVRIEANGSVSQAAVQQSSDFTRLDEAALQAVQSWHVIPGQRNGVPAAMSYNVPIAFTLSGRIATETVPITGSAPTPSWPTLPPAAPATGRWR